MPRAVPGSLPRLLGTALRRVRVVGDIGRDEFLRIGPCQPSSGFILIVRDQLVVEEHAHRAPAGVAAHPAFAGENRPEIVLHASPREESLAPIGIDCRRLSLYGDQGIFATWRIMATVRKRQWRMANGEQRVAWVCDYSDGGGVRRLKTFQTRKAADAWLVTTRHEVAQGTHTAESASITLAEAAQLWIRRGEVERLERSTLAKYRNHAERLERALGTEKLAKLTAPMIEKLKDDLLSSGVPWPTARKTIGALKAILSEAQRRGLVAQNAASAVKLRARAREESKVREGADIPSKAEVSAILAAATGRWRPLLVTAVFTGMRSSELRGLTWADVDLDQKLIHVRQRADQWGVIGAPKSKAGHRTIPMAPMVFNALREWKLACPKADGRLWLVFPNGQGRIESHSNIINRGFNPIQAKSGIAGRFGLHSLRHFFASWAIEQGFSPKRLQSLMGHSSIQMTFDTYGHLFPSIEDDHAKFAAAELAMAQ